MLRGSVMKGDDSLTVKHLESPNQLSIMLTGALLAME